MLTLLLGANLLFWSVQSPRWMKKKGLRPRYRALYVAMIAAQAVLALALIGGALLLDDSERALHRRASCGS